MSTLQLMMLTAVLLQAPLLGVAFLVEFSVGATNGDIDGTNCSIVATSARKASR